MTKITLTTFNLARTANFVPPHYINTGAFGAVTYLSKCVMSSVARNSTFGVKMYSDLEDHKTIFRDNKGKSGIYRFVNLRDGRSYIGSSVDLTRRFRDYLSPLARRARD